MLKLTKPSEITKDVFVSCVNGIANKGLKARLMACVSTIETASNEYATKKSTQELYTITQTKTTKATKDDRVINGHVTAGELKDLYTNQFVPQGTPGRILYDKLLSAPAYGICPYCGVRIVSTLDHFLPKGLYPLLSVTPVNLIPACKDCNTGKLSEYPKTSEEECIHPYYDDIEGFQWLSAEIVQSPRVAFKFSVEGPSHWSGLLTKRVKFHFKAYKLAELYSTHAAVELVNIRGALSSTFNAEGSKGVQAYLLRAATSRFDANKNSWQTAMYMAMNKDLWFCNGGFK